MIFPLRIKIYKELLGILSPQEKELAIGYIRKKLQERSGKNIVTEGDAIGYKGSTGDQRHGLLAAVGSGKFSLVEKNGKRVYRTHLLSGRYLYLPELCLYL